MSTGPLTDAALRRALVDLADGPGAGSLTAGVLDVVAATEQVGTIRLPLMPSLDRRLVFVALVALLALAMLGVLLAAGMRPADPVQRPSGPLVLVVQHWNGQIDPDSVIAHTAISPSTGAAVPLDAGPHNATNLHWTAGASRVAYIGTEAGIFNGLGGPRPRLHLTKLYVANGDWTDPIEVQLQAPLANYAIGDLGDGLLWARSGDRFALLRSTGECNTGPDCLPASDIDVFDAFGRYVTGIHVPEGDLGVAGWSPDGTALGWYTGACPDGQCATDALHWRTIDGVTKQVDITIARIGGVVWRDDGRLIAYTVTPNAGDIERVISVRPDGSDLRELPWDHTVGYAGFSPSGTTLISVDWRTGTLWVDDLATGGRIVATVDVGSNFGGWSPDGKWIILWTDASDDVNRRFFSVVGADGTGLRQLGEGENFVWAPAAIAAAR